MLTDSTTTGRSIRVIRRMDRKQTSAWNYLWYRISQQLLRSLTFHLHKTEKDQSNDGKKRN